MAKSGLMGRRYVCQKSLWHGLHRTDRVQPSRGTTSSLAAPSFLITYSTDTRTVTLHSPTQSIAKLELRGGETFWDWFAAGQATLSARLNGRSTRRESGWKGGWVGWFGYEMKEESLQGYQRRPKRNEGNEEIDACWAWSDRLLERTSEGEWVARGIIFEEHCPESLQDDYDCPDRTKHLVHWLDRLGVSPGISMKDFDSYITDVQSSLFMSNCVSSHSVSPIPPFRPASSGDSYRHQIDACREAIRQGESYELTLTTSFTANLPLQTDPFALYLHLRSHNPAYYSSYMSFPCLDLHILSSSPERFLRISGAREIEMMPIKGTKATIKPGQCVCGSHKGCRGKTPGSVVCADVAKEEDRRIGEELRNDPKERAENLMVCDKIPSMKSK